MSDRYPRVFSPIKVGPVDIENRFYFSPHGIPLQVGSIPSNDLVAYYEERAAGGCGLLMVSLSPFPRAVQASPYLEASVPSFAMLADRMHAHGRKIFGQLSYWWAVPTATWAPLSPPTPTIAPSAVQRFDTFATAHAASREEIRSWVAAFRRSAEHLRVAGFDGIEIHAAHGVSTEQFLSPYFNKRTDEYGGSMENRLRHLVEILVAVREAIGPDMALGIRFNCDEMLPNGLTQDDAREALSWLVERQLFDFADLDVTVEPNQFPIGMPNYWVEPHVYESFVSGVRDVVGSLPVLSVLGRVTTVAEAEQAIESGVVDMVGAARGLLAEPELVKNALEGREEESRVCIACNWCLTSGSWGGWGCSINPASAHERQWGVKTFAPSASASKVVVVGGGPGGLEAARVAAKNGHKVILFESRDALGGQLRPWSSLPNREIFAKPVTWYERQLAQLGVEVRLNTEATEALVLGEQPDAVIVATGSRYATDGESGFVAIPIPGFERGFVHVPEDILERGIRPSGRVVVLDDEGMNTGPGIAQLLAAAGCEVELMTRWLQPVAVNLTGTFEFAFVIPVLTAAGIKISTQTYIKEIGDRQLTVFDVFTNEERTVSDVDAVILATMRRPEASLAEALEGKVRQLYPIGDALAPRMLAAATYEGQKFARMIGDENAPRTFAEAYFEMPSPESYPRPAAAEASAP